MALRLSGLRAGGRPGKHRVTERRSRNTYGKNGVLRVINSRVGLIKRVSNNIHPADARLIN